MNQLSLPEMDTKIILLFLERLTEMTMEERKEILKTIALLNSPLFIAP